MVNDRSRIQNTLWLFAALVLMLFFFTVVSLRSRPGPAEQLAQRSQRLALIHAVRTVLAEVSEAQNGAVMSRSDEDTQYFVDQARTAMARLEDSLTTLRSDLIAHDNRQQLELLIRTQSAMLDFNQLDKQLLELAAQSSNRKAYALALGPVARVLQDMDAGLARMVADHASITTKDATITRLGYETRIGALRIQVLLLPHIAEESADKMDDFESQIDREEQKIAENLASLSSLLRDGDASELAKSRALFAEFDGLRSQIIELSRKNTNVRSLSLALNERRQKMLAVQDALAELERAIETEEVAPTIPTRQ